MKKILIFAASILIAFPVFAEVVSETRAREAAMEFFSAGGATKASVANSLTLVEQNFKAFATPDALVPTYYIYNRQGGGWVIIAADDCVDAVLGYSLDGEFMAEGAPDNLVYWMRNIDDQVVSARRANLDRHQSWVRVNAAGTPVRVLETALWDQESPYNTFCPKISGRTAMTGCVATAASIVCRYHEWPQTMDATFPQYRYQSEDTGSYVTIPAHTASPSYDYSLMPLKYTGSESTAKKEAVANLMVDLGKASKMMYGYSGSGAYTDDLLEALIDYFGYKSTAALKERASYSESVWIKMLKSELDDFGPIIYGGVDPNPYYGGGHQFVFDGYDDQNYFHVNWGWSGYGNGYFLVSKLGNTSQTTGVYSQYQDAILYLEPDRRDPSADDIAKGTFLKVDRTKGQLSITCNYAVDAVLRDAKDSPVMAAELEAGKAYIIDYKSLPKGQYTLSMEHPERQDPYVLTINL